MTAAHYAARMKRRDETRTLADSHSIIDHRAHNRTSGVPAQSKTPMPCRQALAAALSIQSRHFCTPLLLTERQSNDGESLSDYKYDNF